MITVNKNMMFQVEDFFVRISDKGHSLKLAVWNNQGQKLLSDFISSDHSGKFWNLVANNTSDSVAEEVKKRIYS